MSLYQTKIFHFIKKDLVKLEDELLAAVTSPVPLVSDVGIHLVKSGGKRLRPALCLLSARAGKNFSHERAMPIAVALELIHTASLVHDDVIDNADTRRGAPTANAKWGTHIAVLVGDHLFAQAFATVTGKSYSERIGERLSLLVRELCAGEIIQDSYLYSTDINESDYLTRIEKKTANFLAVACETGAVATEADDDTARGLFEYGMNIGMAFQITDDILDITGRTDILGKPAGNDIRQGVLTLPVIYAMKNKIIREKISGIITNPKMTDDDAAIATKIVSASDGVALAQRLAREYISRAKMALPENLNGDIRSTLTDAADYIESRNA